MVLFKKPNRKFRQRVTHTDSEDEAPDEPPEPKERKSRDSKTSEKEKFQSSGPSSSRDGPSKEDKTDSQQSIPATKLLSFHDEEEDTEVFKLKKSNYSKRLAKQLEKERKKKQENLCAAPTEEDSSSVLKGSSDNNKDGNSSQQKNEGNVFSGKDAEDMDVDDDEENDDSSEVKENPFKDVLQSGVIPDAATIYAMKKHRQLAREMGDFIPLEEPENTDENKSRLVREDDNDRSDDDDDEEPSRLNFTVNTGAIERQKVREAFLSLQEDPNEELENEDAAELERWEREQIRKGVSIVQGLPTQPQQMPETSFYSYVPSAMDPTAYYTASTVTEVNETSSKSFIAALQESHKSDLTTSSIKARLEERLTSLKEIHNSHKNDLENCQKEIVDANELIERIELEAPELSRRFALYQQIRGYVTDLVECLDLKVSHIEVLDRRLMELYKTRANYLISRRQQDVRDQSDEYSLLCSRVLKGSSEIASEKNGHQDENKLRRAAEREGRRMRRRKQRDHSALLIKHHEGMSSDDEEPDIEIMKYLDKREQILCESKEIFEDVVKEFGQIDGVMSNFEKWKSEQLDSYCEAFVPLCLPKIFGPFVRIEMLPWNPLEDELEIESTNWYKILALYDYDSSKNEDAENGEDPDMNLLPNIIEKILLPKVTAFVRDVWYPLSTKQTLLLVKLTKKLNHEYPSISGKSKQLQALLQAVCTRINKSLDDDIFVPLYPKELLESRTLGSSMFFQRQFWSTVKLLENIVMWDGIIAEQPLQDMALSSLLNRYLLMGLHTSIVMKDTVEKCKVIVASFPKSWLSTKGSGCLPLLKQFSQYLVKYAQTFYTPAFKRGYGDAEERDTVKEVIQLLIAINSLDDAVTLAKEFSISGFKKEK